MLQWKYKRLAAKQKEYKRQFFSVLSIMKKVVKRHEGDSDCFNIISNTVLIIRGEVIITILPSVRDTLVLSTESNSFTSQLANQTGDN